MIPTPLKTILCKDRYPFAVAEVKNNKIVSTVSYAYPPTLEQCYAELQGWRAAYPDRNFIMVEMKEIDEPMNTYWVAV